MGSLSHLIFRPSFIHAFSLGTAPFFSNCLYHEYGVSCSSILDYPVGLEFGPSGDLYVSSFFNDRVLRFNGANGDFVETFSLGGGLDGPTGLTFGPDGDLYVSSHVTDAILRFDGQTGTFIDAFASGGGLGLPADISQMPDSKGSAYPDVLPDSSQDGRFCPEPRPFARSNAPILPLTPR